MAEAPADIVMDRSTSYRAIHGWINYHFPRTGRCEFCARTTKRTGYASAEHRYTRNRTDWFELCPLCHAWFDGGQSRHNRDKTHCKRGHPFDDANTYRRPGGKQRLCRVCARELRRLNRRR